MSDATSANTYYCRPGDRLEVSQQSWPETAWSLFSDPNSWYVHVGVVCIHESRYEAQTTPLPEPQSGMGLLAAVVFLLFLRRVRR